MARDNLKTKAACRDIDLSKQIAEYLHGFISDKDGLLFETRNGTPYLQPGMDWHAFRPFRKTWLRGKRCQEDINNFWMGHKPKTMSELYFRMDEELEQRLREVEIVSVGFEIPACVVPKCSKMVIESEVEVAA